MTLLCKIFGHKWELKRLPFLQGVSVNHNPGPFDEIVGFTSVGYHKEPSKCCFRCGTIQK